MVRHDEMSITKGVCDMRVQRSSVIGMLMVLILALGGCASTGDSTSDAKSTSETAAKSESSAKAEKATKTLDIPKNSPLAKVELGMTEQQVRQLLGEPVDIRGYPTGKNWIPFYFGGDTYRFDWIYRNVGKVIFGNTSRFSRATKVVDVIDNPNEP